MSELESNRMRRRWRTPMITLVIAAAVIAFLQVSDLVESHLKFPLTAFVVAMSILVLLGWLLFRAPFSRRTRVRWFGGIVAAIVALGVGLRLTTTLGGTYTGAGAPKLMWRWSPKPDAGLALPATQPSATPVDLTTTSPTDFPEFLGPGRRNSLSGLHLSRDWSANPPRRLWRQPIGVGWSSFAIVGDYAVTQEQRGSEELTVCYEVLTGKARWEHANQTRFSEWQGGDGPRATPTIEAGRVYVMGATGVIDCLDGATGSVIWTRNVLSDVHAPNLSFGKSCSPLLVDDLVIVTGGGHSGPSLVAYKKQTGEIAWTGGSEEPGYASPVVAKLGGVRQILTIDARSADAFEPTSGKQLWHYPWPGMLPKNVQPIPLDADRLLIGAGYGVGAAVLGIRNGTSVSTVWSNRYLKPKFANMVVRDQFVYGLDDGVLTCLDVRDGKRKWRDGRYGHGQILLVDDLLLVQEESGDIALVEAMPAGFKELTSFPALTGKTWTPPALSGHRLLVRNDREAACYELP